MYYCVYYVVKGPDVIVPMFHTLRRLIVPMFHTLTSAVPPIRSLVTSPLHSGHVIGYTRTFIF